VLLPTSAPLFTDRERRLAQRRLEDHNLDVDAFLARVGDELP
jgi:hypothetical protein